jgi:hypothetical protein
MALLEGKSPTEKKKIIAAGVLGLIALVALYMAFGRSSSTTASSKDGAKPKPTASSSSSSDKGDVVMPPVSQQNQVYESTPIVYDAGQLICSGAGRNIICVSRAGPAMPDLSCADAEADGSKNSATGANALYTGKFRQPANRLRGLQGLSSRGHGRQILTGHSSLFQPDRAADDVY